MIALYLNNPINQLTFKDIPYKLIKQTCPFFLL